MITRTRLTYLLAAVVPLSSAGCLIVRAGGSCGSTVWTTVATERLVIDTANLKALEVRTHNGSINFEDQPAGTSEAYVIFSKKGGGRTHAEAEEALEAISVYVKPTADGTQKIGWKWKGEKHSSWKAQVGVDIRAPGNLRFDGETHNGSAEINGITGEVRIVTHNGRVTVDSRDGKLYAQTHNGGIKATYAGKEVTLITHNGRVVADLSRCGAVDGTITTHNGGIEVVVGEGASASLTCTTHNGSIQCDVPLDELKASRRKLTGKIGSGEGDLEVTTHNGNIRITKAQG